MEMISTYVVMILYCILLNRRIENTVIVHLESLSAVNGTYAQIQHCSISTCVGSRVQFAYGMIPFSTSSVLYFEVVACSVHTVHVRVGQTGQHCPCGVTGSDPSEHTGRRHSTAVQSSGGHTGQHCPSGT